MPLLSSSRCHPHTSPPVCHVLCRMQLFACHGLPLTKDALSFTKAQQVEVLQLADHRPNHLVCCMGRLITCRIRHPACQAAEIFLQSICMGTAAAPHERAGCGVG
jgi:hypothetical protein